MQIEQAYFDEALTPSRFDFFDSAQRNKEVQTLKAGHYLTIFIILFLLASILIGTFIEIIERSK